MSKKYFSGCSARRAVPDCWNARLLKNASYSEAEGLPLFQSAKEIPGDLLSFKYLHVKADTSKWVHFYGNDNLIERVWESPEFWAESLKRFAGIISPDLSVYRDMPPKQLEYNIYRNRVLAHWFDQNGIPVIPNVRWADKNSYNVAFDGLDQNGIVCVSTFGILADSSDRKCFTLGLAEMMRRLQPTTVLVYGRMPREIFASYQQNGTQFIQYTADIEKAHKRGER